MRCGLHEQEQEKPRMTGGQSRAAAQKYKSLGPQQQNPPSSSRDPINPELDRKSNERTRQGGRRIHPPPSLSAEDVLLLHLALLLHFQALP